MATSYKSRDSARRQARKRGLKADSVYQDQETARWVVGDKPKGKALVKVEKPKSTKKLDALAKQIAVSLKKADDYLVRMAQLITEAKAECAAEKISFKTWLAESKEFDLSYNYAISLAKAGASSDPVAAIEAMRASGREAVQRHREKSKVTLRNVTEKPKPVGKLEQALVAVLGPEGAKRFVEDQVAKMGFTVAKDEPAEPEFADLDSLKRQFRTLTQADKMAFIEWACAEMEDPETVPPWLKRERANA